MLITIFRVIKFSFQDIFRNIWLSLVTILILVLTLFSVNLLLSVKVISATTVETIKQKIDISLYLVNDAEEKKIISLKNRLSALDQVEEVIYISQDEALKKFQASHKNDPEIIESLKELNKNPLSPSLAIKPKDISKYDDLINQLNRIDDPIIGSRDFDNNRQMLNKIDIITKKVSDAGFVVSALFILITLLVIFNTVKVGIYTHRGEITIMRLVGASNWFIKAPFLVSSLIYTLIGTIIAVSIFLLFLSLLHPYLQTFFTGYDINILAYFQDNFFSVFGLQFLIAAAVNVIASLMAVGKYSHV